MTEHTAGVAQTTEPNFASCFSSLTHRHAAYGHIHTDTDTHTHAKVAWSLHQGRGNDLCLKGWQVSVKILYLDILNIVPFNTLVATK